MRWSGGRERAAGACPWGGAGPTGGGAVSGLTAAVAAAAAAVLGWASLVTTGPAAVPARDPGDWWRREAGDGDTWRWWASLERPPSSVSRARRRAAEGGV